VTRRATANSLRHVRKQNAHRQEVEQLQRDRVELTLMCMELEAQVEHLWGEVVAPMVASLFPAYTGPAAPDPED
jgi:hypothetical protein